MPSQADEEAHQLSYLQKHITNILALLAEPVEGEDDESLVGILKGSHFTVNNLYFNMHQWLHLCSLLHCLLGW